jgi:hypothetical protein
VGKQISRQKLIFKDSGAVPSAGQFILSSKMTFEANEYLKLISKVNLERYRLLELWRT